MKTTENLVLHYEDLDQHADALFQEMKRSSTLREHFLSHPEAVLAERILDGSLPSTATPIDQAYRQLFTLLHHEPFRVQIEQCEREMPLQQRARPIRHQAIVQAAVESGAIEPHECEEDHTLTAETSSADVLSILILIGVNSHDFSALSRQDLLSSLASAGSDLVA